MKVKEQISINEFDGKHFQVRLVEPADQSKAVLTHYLHNIHNGVSAMPLANALTKAKRQSCRAFRYNLFSLRTNANAEKRIFASIPNAA